MLDSSSMVSCFCSGQGLLLWSGGGDAAIQGASALVLLVLFPLSVCHGALAPNSDRTFHESCRKLVRAQAIASTGSKPKVCTGSVQKVSRLND